MTPTPTDPDPLRAIPDPAVVRAQLADAVRRRDLLRSLLRIAVRKASYDTTPAPVPFETKGVGRG